MSSAAPDLSPVPPGLSSFGSRDERPPRLSLPPASAVSAAALPFDPVLIAAGAGIAGRSIARAIRGWRRYPGNVEDICRAVIRDCWNGQFFAGSAGHFRQFWTRDLAMCTPALCRLGERERVVASWAWALERFDRAGRITTTIFARRYPRDVYAYACDSLPFLLHALRAADAGHLIARHRQLLAREVDRYCETVFDPELGLARPNGYFSGPRDCMTGRSTVFANTCLALLGDLLAGEPRLPNPLRGHDLRAKILEQYWMGDHFRDALDRDLPSGDGNVWPFFFGVFTDGQLRRQALATLERRGFTRPLPLRYFERRLPDSELPAARAFTPNYQGDPSWTQLGPAYLHVLASVDRRQMQRERATAAAFIERDGNYLELYDTDGKPYRGRAWLYHADEGMIWAAMFLDLYR